MNKIWDVLVIGAGPAGLGAATAAAGEGVSCACIDRLGPGGALMNLGHVQDYPDAAPDAASDATGADLAAGLTDAATAAGVELLFGEVQRLEGGPPWSVVADGETHRARAVVLATGLSAGTLGVPDEESFEGRGLSHCAACDGLLFSGQNVVVTGNDRWTTAEALELAGMAAAVTLVGDPGMAPPADNVTVMPGRVVALAGAEGLERVTVRGPDGVERDLAAEGLFAYLDKQPLLGFAAGRIALDATGRAVVDEDMRASAAGLFAAGDVRAGSPQTLAAALEDGRRAGLAAAAFVRRTD